MRIIAGAGTGMRMIVEYERLTNMQKEDGPFPMGWAYKHGSTGMLFGNEGRTAALAVQAINAFQTLDKELI